MGMCFMGRRDNGDLAAVSKPRNPKFIRNGERNMNARKMLAVLFAILLMIGLAACNRNRNNEVTSLPGTAGAGTELSPSPSLPDESSMVELDNRAGRYEFSDANVTIDLSLDREEYTVADMLDITVTITNNASTPIVFTSGSGSNIVPDGLQVTLENLTPMYRPLAATMDMQYSHLSPGESATFHLPFAPYVGLGENLAGPGLDQNLDFFRDNPDYAPVEAGEIRGTLTFTYQLMETESIEGPYNELMEGGNPNVITGEFVTNIVEANSVADNTTIDDAISDITGEVSP